MAFLFFGLSVTLDLLQIPSIDPYLAEDGAKLVGLISWLAYFFRCGTLAIQEDLNRVKS